MDLFLLFSLLFIFTFCIESNYILLEDGTVSNKSIPSNNIMTLQSLINIAPDLNKTLLIGLDSNIYTLNQMEIGCGTKLTMLGSHISKLYTNAASISLFKLFESKISLPNAEVMFTNQSLCLFHLLGKGPMIVNDVQISHEKNENDVKGVAFLVENGKTFLNNITSNNIQFSSDSPVFHGLFYVSHSAKKFKISNSCFSEIRASSSEGSVIHIDPSRNISSVKKEMNNLILSSFGNKNLHTSSNNTSLNNTSLNNTSSDDIDSQTIFIIDREYAEVFGESQRKKRSRGKDVASEQDKTELETPDISELDAEDDDDEYGIEVLIGKNTTFKNCEAKYGGALYISVEENIDVTLFGCKFLNNSAVVGPAAYIDLTNYKTPRVPDYPLIVFSTVFLDNNHFSDSTSNSEVKTGYLFHVQLPEFKNLTIDERNIDSFVRFASCATTDIEEIINSSPSGDLSKGFKQNGKEKRKENVESESPKYISYDDGRKNTTSDKLSSYIIRSSSPEKYCDSNEFIFFTQKNTESALLDPYDESIFSDLFIKDDEDSSSSFTHSNEEDSSECGEAGNPCTTLEDLAHTLSVRNPLNVRDTYKGNKEEEEESIVATILFDDDDISDICENVTFKSEVKKKSSSNKRINENENEDVEIIDTYLLDLKFIGVSKEETKLTLNAKTTGWSPLATFVNCRVTFNRMNLNLVRLKGIPNGNESYSESTLTDNFALLFTQSNEVISFDNVIISSDTVTPSASATEESITKFSSSEHSFKHRQSNELSRISYPIIKSLQPLKFTSCNFKGVKNMYPITTNFEEGYRVAHNKGLIKVEYTLPSSSTSDVVVVEISDCEFTNSYSVGLSKAEKNSADHYRMNNLSIPNITLSEPFISVSVQQETKNEKSGNDNNGKAVGIFKVRNVTINLPRSYEHRVFQMRCCGAKLDVDDLKENGVSPNAKANEINSPNIIIEYDSKAELDVKNVTISNVNITETSTPLSIYDTAALSVCAITDKSNANSDNSAYPHIKLSDIKFESINASAVSLTILNPFNLNTKSKSLKSNIQSNPSVNLVNCGIFTVQSHNNSIIECSNIKFNNITLNNSPLLLINDISKYRNEYIENSPATSHLNSKSTHSNNPSNDSICILNNIDLENIKANDNDEGVLIVEANASRRINNINSKNIELKNSKLLCFKTCYLVRVPPDSPKTTDVPSFYSNRYFERNDVDESSSFVFSSIKYENVKVTVDSLEELHDAAFENVNKTGYSENDIYYKGSGHLLEVKGITNNSSSPESQALYSYPMVVIEKEIINCVNVTTPYGLLGENGHFEDMIVILNNINVTFKDTQTKSLLTFIHSNAILDGVKFSGEDYSQSPKSHNRNVNEECPRYDANNDDADDYTPSNLIQNTYKHFCTDNMDTVSKTMMIIGHTALIMLKDTDAEIVNCEFKYWSNSAINIVGGSLTIDNSNFTSVRFLPFAFPTMRMNIDAKNSSITVKNNTRFFDGFPRKKEINNQYKLIAWICDNNTKVTVDRKSDSWQFYFPYTFNGSVKVNVTDGNGTNATKNKPVNGICIAEGVDTDKGCPYKGDSKDIKNPEKLCVTQCQKRLNYNSPYVPTPVIDEVFPVEVLENGNYTYSVNVKGKDFYPFNFYCSLREASGKRRVTISRAFPVNETFVNCPILDQDLVGSAPTTMKFRLQLTNTGSKYSVTKTLSFTNTNYEPPETNHTEIKNETSTPQNILSEDKSDVLQTILIALVAIAVAAGIVFLALFLVIKFCRGDPKDIRRSDLENEPGIKDYDLKKSRDIKKFFKDEPLRNCYEKEMFYMEDKFNGVKNDDNKGQKSEEVEKKDSNEDGKQKEMKNQTNENGKNKKTKRQSVKSHTEDDIESDSKIEISSLKNSESDNVFDSGDEEAKNSSNKPISYS